MTVTALLLSLATLPTLFGGEEEADRSRLLRGVEVLERVGSPGTITVFGDEAFCILTGGQSPDALAAAAHYGDGRVVAIAHDGYLSRAALADEGSGKAAFLANAIHWAADKEGALSIGVLGRAAGIVHELEKSGHDVLSEVKPRPNSTFDVLLWTGEVKPALLPGLAEYVRTGGGLVTAVCPWGWEQVNARASPDLRTDLPQNVVLARMGLVFAQGTADETIEGGYSVAASRSADVHAGHLLDAITDENAQIQDLSPLVKAVRSVPRAAEDFQSRLSAALAEFDASAAPRPDRPLKARDSLGRLYVAQHGATWRDLIASDVRAVPGVDAFPGSVPADAKRVTRSLALENDVAGWQSTGLYLSPGEVCVLTASRTAGWSIRIGCHTDRLWHKDRWHRWPEISHEQSVEEGTTQLVSPFGGPVYFEAGRGARRTLRVELKGVVLAPRFVLGDAESATSWETNRDAPGPWTELEGKNLVLSVPSSIVRKLDDPTPIVEYWDAVLASHCKLAGIDVPKRRERFVPDAQISAGYMHSGYPIMMQLDQVRAKKGTPPLFDLEQLKTRGAWGPFHELGHNRQRPWWTFSGTGEVTCNLFSLYTSQTMCGIEPWDHPWLAGHKAKGAKYLADGADFEVWKRKPGIALLCYAWIQREFGWAPYERVMREYEELPDGDRPRSNQARIDEWVVRMSHATERDLRPFFTMWGWPLSNSVTGDASLDELDEWLPDDEELTR